MKLLAWTIILFAVAVIAAEFMADWMGRWKERNCNKTGKIKAR